MVWNNYEALHYYFPVQFRPEIERPHPGKLEWISIHDDPKDPKDKAARLAGLGRAPRSPREIDRCGACSGKRDPELEAITKRWFDLVQQTGDVQIFKKPARRYETRARSIRAISSLLQPGTAVLWSIDTSSSLLLLLHGKKVGLVFDLSEFLGPVFAGDGDAESEFLPVELVDRLRGLTLGFFRALFNRQVQCRVGLGLGVDLHFAGIVGSIHGRLELLAVEGPLGVDAVAVGGPGSLERFQKLGLRLVIAERLRRGSYQETESSQSDTASSVKRLTDVRIPRCFVNGMMVIPRRLQNPFAQAACSVH